MDILTADFGELEVRLAAAHPELFNPPDLPYRSVYNQSGQPSAKKLRAVFNEFKEFAKRHNVTILWGNKTPEDDPGAFVIPRNSDLASFTAQPDKEQFRFPRSKKRRIQKKWANNPANWRNKPPVRVFVAKSRLRNAGSPPDAYFLPQYMRRNSGDRGPVVLHRVEVDRTEARMLLSRSAARQVDEIFDHADRDSALDGKGFNIEIRRSDNGEGYESAPVKLDAEK